MLGLRPTKGLTEAAAGVATRSPVTKTRLRVVKSETSDPVVAAWQQSSPRQLTRREVRVEKHLESTDRLPMASDSQLTQL